MKSQNQYTIYSLNDVVTDSVAPSNPYKGQLWVDTSSTPPVTKVYDGSAWKEQNGTDELKSSVETVTEKESALETTVSGISSTVTETTKTVETLEDDMGNAETNITNLQSDVSTLQQTAKDITAEVSDKVDNAYGSSSSTFGWSLKSTGFYVYSNKSTVVSITSSGLSVSGAIDATSGSIGNLTIDGQLTFGGNSSYYINPNYNDGDYYIKLPGFEVDDQSGAVFSGCLSAPSGTIGGFTISTTCIYNGTNSMTSTTAGIYLGTDGINVGGAAFTVTKAGVVNIKDASISFSRSKGTISYISNYYTATLSKSGLDITSYSSSTTTTADGTLSLWGYGIMSTCSVLYFGCTSATSFTDGTWIQLSSSSSGRASGGVLIGINSTSASLSVRKSSVSIMGADSVIYELSKVMLTSFNSPSKPLGIYYGVYSSIGADTWKTVDLSSYFSSIVSAVACQGSSSLSGYGGASVYWSGTTLYVGNDGSNSKSIRYWVMGYKKT